MRKICGLLALAFAVAAAAQEYPPGFPARPTGMVVGFPPGGGTVSRSPAEFAALVRADTARYAKIVKDIGLKVE